MHMNVHSLHMYKPACTHTPDSEVFLFPLCMCLMSVSVSVSYVCAQSPKHGLTFLEFICKYVFNIHTNNIHNMYLCNMCVWLKYPPTQLIGLVANHLICLCSWHDGQRPFGDGDQSASLFGPAPDTRLPLPQYLGPPQAQEVLFASYWNWGLQWPQPPRFFFKIPPKVMNLLQSSKCKIMNFHFFLREKWAPQKEAMFPKKQISNGQWGCFKPEATSNHFRLLAFQILFEIEKTQKWDLFLSWDKKISTATVSSLRTSRMRRCGFDAHVDIMGWQ